MRTPILPASAAVTRVSPWLVVNATLKVGLIALLLLAVLWPDLPQFEGKAMTGRALTFPIATLIVPAAWWARFRAYPYPHAVDILLVLPFFIDTAGNAADLYDTISWWDDANHLVNWAILTAAFGQVLVRVRLPLPRPVVAGLALGFGAVTDILWELAEYVTFIRDNEEELATAYTDTLGDLTLSLGGAAIAAVLTVTALWRPAPEAAWPERHRPASPAAGGGEDGER